MSGAEPTSAHSPADTEPDLADLITLHEETDWQHVPSVGTKEAAVWTQRLIEAQSDLKGSR
jgi:hypothetical protein